MRVLNYGKRLGVVLAGVLLGTSLGLSSVASGENIGSSGFARPGFNPAGRGLNRGAPIFPVNRVGPGAGQLPSGSDFPARPIARPVVNAVIVNPVIDEEENVCAVEADLFIKDACVIAVDGR
jgi:hypothetical protein